MIYVAFLRGINVGGNAKVPMSDLKKAFEELGYSNVKTLLNSGNVIFDTKEPEPQILTQEIENKLTQSFGFEVSVIVRTQKEIQELIHSKPFADTKTGSDIRLYVTFLPESPFQVFSVVDLSAEGTTGLMKELEKKHGKKITTRNWNTILRLAATTP